MLAAASTQRLLFASSFTCSCVNWDQLSQSDSLGPVSNLPLASKPLLPNEISVLHIEPFPLWLSDLAQLRLKVKAMGIKPCIINSEDTIYLHFMS